jgi:hypothetical protein
MLGRHRGLHRNEVGRHAPAGRDGRKALCHIQPVVIGVVKRRKVPCVGRPRVPKSRIHGRCKAVAIVESLSLDHVIEKKLPRRYRRLNHSAARQH